MAGYIETQAILENSNMQLEATIQSNWLQIDAEIESTNHQIAGAIDGKYTFVDYKYENYDGPVRIVPGDTEQVLATADRYVQENIIIEKIPSNYGKITWNGSVMTIT